ncbi:DUF6985 domain-containing protein [Solibacillus ferritrahens]|uniref:DUF6985 domain-containing protein n=1 Tax=Solibacillus ferritrahens TaxID=3098620 RepID=UPI00300BAB42
MDLLHPIFGELELNEFEEYEAIRLIKFSGLEKKVKITFDDEINEEHCRAYQSFIENLDRITPDIIQSIIEYQNECHDDTDYTASFKYFENTNDVIESTELFEIALQTELHGGVTDSNLYHKVMKEELDGIEEERYVVLLFEANWVNDDYRILSVALANEKVIYVTDENITV